MGYEKMSPVSLYRPVIIIFYSKIWPHIEQEKYTL